MDSTAYHKSWNFAMKTTQLFMLALSYCETIFSSPNADIFSQHGWNIQKVDMKLSFNYFAPFKIVDMNYAA